MKIFKILICISLLNNFFITNSSADNIVSVYTFEPDTGPSSGLSVWLLYKNNKIEEAFAQICASCDCPEAAFELDEINYDPKTKNFSFKGLERLCKTDPGTTIIFKGKLDLKKMKLTGKINALDKNNKIDPEYNFEKANLSANKIDSNDSKNYLDFSSLKRNVDLRKKITRLP